MEKDKIIDEVFEVKEKKEDGKMKTFFKNHKVGVIVTGIALVAGCIATAIFASGGDDDIVIGDVENGSFTVTDSSSDDDTEEK